MVLRGCAHYFTAVANNGTAISAASARDKMLLLPPSLAHSRAAKPRIGVGPVAWCGRSASGTLATSARVSPDGIAQTRQSRRMIGDKTCAAWRGCGDRGGRKYIQACSRKPAAYRVLKTRAYIAAHRGATRASRRTSLRVPPPAHLRLINDIIVRVLPQRRRCRARRMRNRTRIAPYLRVCARGGIVPLYEWTATCADEQRVTLPTSFRQVRAYHRNCAARTHRRVRAAARTSMMILRRGEKT